MADKEEDLFFTWRPGSWPLLVSQHTIYFIYLIAILRPSLRRTDGGQRYAGRKPNCVQARPTNIHRLFTGIGYLFAEQAGPMLKVKSGNV